MPASPIVTQARQNFLNDEIAFRNSTNRELDKTNCCRYGGPIGCAIGRKIQDKRICAELDETGPINILRAFMMLPDDLRMLGQDFLTYMQRLHDDETCWTPQGLSPIGHRFVADIKSIFNLE